MIDSAQELKAKIPIITKEQWLKRYKDRKWLSHQIDLAFEYYSSYEASILWPTSAWMRKLHGWLSRAWEDKKSKPKSLEEIELE